MISPEVGIMLTQNTVRLDLMDWRSVGYLPHKILDPSCKKTPFCNIGTQSSVEPRESYEANRQIGVGDSVYIFVTDALLTDYAIHALCHACYGLRNNAIFMGC